MGVPQYTTPTFALSFEETGLDLRNATSVYVTFKSGNNKLTKTGDNLVVGEKTIEVYLTQNETAKFLKTVDIQANWIVNGNRVASEVVTFEITEQLLQKVIE